jgi:hypothetical protein
MSAENFAHAAQRRAEWMQRLNSLFEQTRKTGLVQYEAVCRVIDEIIGDILDRPAACYAVVGLRQPDPTLHEHGLTVCTLSVMLGHALGYSREQLQELGTGGLLHDIGLTRLPRNMVKQSITMSPAQQALTQFYQRYQADADMLQIVSYLIRTIGVYPLYSVVALNSGELAVVGAITPGKVHLPFLYICRDRSGNPCRPPVPLDLIHEPAGGRAIRDVRNALREGLDVEAVLRQVAA